MCRWPTGEGGQPDPAVVGLLYVACVSGELWRIDIAELRLPDALTIPGFGFAATGLAASWIEGGSPPTGPVTAGACVGVFLLLLHAAGGLGMGDVKLGALLALAAGPLGGHIVVAGTIIAFVVAGALALAALGLGGAEAPRPIPFGPFLLFGFWSSLALTAA